MGYQTAIEATGVKVREYTEFGSYQGTWIAILEDNQVIEGSYGSCSGCDAYQAEFSCSDDLIIVQDDGKYYKENYYWNEDHEITKEEADKLNEKHLEALKTFGQSYVDTAETFEEIIARYKIKSEDEYAWGDDKDIYEWLKIKSQQLRIKKDMER